jgi:microcystin-dependent protein
MGLSRLDNFLKSTRGTIIYVDPNAIDSTDSIENQGNSLGRPFKTIQRALIEASRFSYQRGLDNDRFNKTTIVLYPGDHLVDNRPGWIPDGTANYRLRSGATSSDFGEFSSVTDFDLTSANNSLYKLNSIYGGVIVPRGTSIVGMDLRKTKIRPLYVPNPENDQIERSAVFRITGACYFWQFTILDSDPNGVCYKDYTSNLFVPNFSHHKLTAFEYADGVNDVKIADDFQTFETARTDLDIYYEKIGIAYGNSSGRPIIPDYPSDEDIQPVIDEYRIVGSRGAAVGISSIKSGDGLSGNTTITVTTTSAFPQLSVDSPIQISGVNALGYNGQYVVSSVASSTQFTYQVQNIPTNLLPTVNGANVSLAVDTVTSASPYIFNISLRSVFGMCGMLADGAKADGFKSMVVAQYTGIGLQKDDKAFVKYDTNSGSYQDFTSVSNLHSDSLARYKPSYESYHIRAINNSYIQIVSVFAIGYANHFQVESGGDFSVNNSNSNFGAKAFQAMGFRKDAFAKDDLGYITHIVTPKERVVNQVSVGFLPLDYAKTVSVGDTTKLYFYGYNDQEIAPPEVVEGFRIGAQNNDVLYLDIAQSGVTTTYSARVVMPNTQLSAEKKYYVGRAAGINSITSNLITLTSKHDLINGETIRVISETGQLPDGLESDTVYYTITDTVAVGIGSNQIKVAKTLNDAVNNNPITINSRGGALKIVSRVSDKVSGYIGHPIGFDTSNSQWYIKVAIAASENSIYPALQSSVLYDSTARTYFKRTPDTRDSSDTIYKVRYVIPKDAVNLGAAPIEGYILQESNNVIGAGTTEIQKYFSPTASSLSNSTELRNFRFISGAQWSGGVASINTELPHDLRVGAQVEVLNVVSTGNTAGIASTAFNGTFTVTGITSVRQFTYSLTNNPGTFTGVTTNRTTSLPYFKKKQLSTTYQVYKSEEIQKYVQNVQDGVYYLTLINYGNAPSVDPFTHLRFGQPIDKLYPQTNRDSVVSDANPANTFANSNIIGQVDIDDPQNSITKQTEEKRQYDLGGVIAINNIRSASGTAHTIYTPHGHRLSGITSVSITNAGAGYTSGTFYAVPLGLSTTGRAANARVTVSAAGTITNVRIMDGGGAYKVGDVVSILSGIATYAPYTQASVTVTKIYDHVGESIRVSGVTSEGYSGYNTLYKITGISTFNQINVQSSREVIGIGSDLSVQAANAQAVLTGKTLGISTFTYYAQTGIGTLAFTGAHGLRKNGKVRISGADQALFNNDFIVTEINSNTSVSINIGITTSSPSTGGNITVYLPALTSYGGDVFGENFVHIINPKENEASAGRLLTQYAGITTTLGGQILSTDSDSTPVVISNADILGFRIGDYFQIDDEIFRIKETVLGSALLVYRALFGTPRQDHTAGTALKRIRITPVELRRNSIIRASAHTFEYLGFGPGNYSTAFPDRQDRVLTDKEIQLSRSTKLDGGAVVYSGMDDRGEFQNAKEYEVPIETVTGEQPDISPSKKIETFDSPVVLNTKLTSNDEIEAKSLLIAGDADVARKFTVGIGTTPATAGTPGDVVYKGRPEHNQYLGWIYTVDNQWEPWGFIGTLPNGLVFGSANQVLYKSPSNTNTGNPEFLFKDNTTLIIGAGTSTGFDSQKLQVTGNAYISNGIGVGTTASRSALDVVGNARISGVSTLSTLSSSLVNVGIVSITSGIVTASSGIVTYYGDGQYLTNLPAGSQWTGVQSGLGTGIYRNGNVGVGTTLTPARLNVVTGVSTSVDGGLARFLAPNLAVSSSAGIAIGRTFGTDSFQSVLLTYNYQGSTASSGSYLSLAHAGQGNTLVIADTDRVGVGTATPQSKHHVVGNSRIDGASTFNGNATVSAGSSFIGAGTIPVGGIIMWSGAVGSIPTGWALCNGSSGTPDLRDRFVVGAGSAYTPGNTGGSDGVTLTTDQIPSHSHSGSTGSAGSHSHTASSSSTVTDPGHLHTWNFYQGGWNTGTSGNTCVANNLGTVDRNTSTAFTGITVATTTTVNSGGTHDHSVTLTNTGGGSSHENRPPYYALAFIMRTV